jgi:hypothetical protein
MTSEHSRFEAVSRRSFMLRSVALGALVAVPGLACSSDDKQTFSSTSANTGNTGTAATPTTAATTATGATSAATATSAASSTAAAPSGDALPAGAQLVVNFSFAPSSSGQVHSPYIVVWIEDSAGEMVKTVSLWYKARESKYLNELKRWATVESAFQSTGGSDPVDTVSGATRVAGSYSVMWDGTDAQGAAVSQGNYFVCIEAAREHGPYELIREAVSIGATAGTTPFADSGELTSASAEYRV